MDSSAIDAAVISVLANDATLSAMMPNGVYYDLAPQEALRYVLVSLLESEDEGEFGQRALEHCHYLVKAVGCSVSNPAMREAAARIDQLLEDQPLTIEGYGWCETARERRIRMTEPDDANASIQWLHRGGVYSIIVTPAP